MREVEVAPGIFFSSVGSNYKLLIRSATEETVSWDFDEIKLDPQEWFNSLQTVALAMRHGPTIAFKRVKEAKEEKKTPVGSLLCNVCNIKFTVGPGYPHVFTAKLNGKTFCDYQCSEMCNKLRREVVFKQELGEVIKTFPKVVSKLREKDT